jgi:serine/threonine protein kinase
MPKVQKAQPVQMPKAQKAQLKTCKKITDIEMYFKKIELKGKGGFGEVFSAAVTPAALELHPAMPDIVAIKSINVKPDTDFEMLQNELAILKNLTVEHSIKYYGCFINATDIYVVMDLVQGIDVSDLLFPYKGEKEYVMVHPPLEMKLFLAKEILAAIAELHALDIVHRDIKIQNVMFTKDNRVKLIDYGFACKLSLDPEAWGCVSTCGTDGYRDFKIDPGNLTSMKLADWWAYGQILVILFTGNYWGTYDEAKDTYRKLTPAEAALFPASLQEVMKDLTNPRLAQKNRPGELELRTAFLSL